MPMCAMVDFKRRAFFLCDESEIHPTLVSLADCGEGFLFYKKGSFKVVKGHKVDVYDAVVSFCKKEKFINILKESVEVSIKNF